MRFHIATRNCYTYRYTELVALLDWVPWLTDGQLDSHDSYDSQLRELVLSVRLRAKHFCDPSKSKCRCPFPKLVCASRDTLYTMGQLVLPDLHCASKDP